MPRKTDAPDNKGQQRKAEVHARNEARKAEHDAQKAAERAEREAEDRPDDPSGTEAYGPELEVSDVPMDPPEVILEDPANKQKATPEGADRPAEVINSNDGDDEDGDGQPNDEIPPVIPGDNDTGVIKLRG